jgi:hypothetical protein
MGGLKGARSQAIALGFKVAGGILDAAILTGSREISLDSKRVGVVSNDGSSKTVRSGGTAGAANSNGGNVGVVTSDGSTAASNSSGWDT